MLDGVSEIEKAWLAGLVDGEGYIGLGRQGGRWSPNLTIGMTHRPTIEKVASMVGVGVQVRKRPEGKPWRLCNLIQVTGQKCLALVEALRPYLVTKENEAWLLLEASAQCIRRTGGGNPLTTEDKALREGYALALQHAKERGVN